MIIKLYRKNSSNSGLSVIIASSTAALTARISAFKYKTHTKATFLIGREYLTVEIADALRASQFIEKMSIRVDSKGI